MTLKPPKHEAGTSDFESTSMNVQTEPTELVGMKLKQILHSWEVGQNWQYIRLFWHLADD